KVLSRVHQLDSGKCVLLHISDGGETQELHVQVEGLKKLTVAQQRQITRDVEIMFNLDWNLSKFYQAIQHRPEYTWIERQKCGRMLVTPTVWEDLAKTLLTTNTTWSQTKNM